MLYKKIKRKWILENFDVDMTTGIVRHKTGHLAGKVVGSENSGGYLLTKKNNEAWYVHRIVAQMKSYSCIANYHVHHLNEDKGDNRPENLVLLTQQQHNQIRKTSGRQKLRYRGIIKKEYSFGTRYFAKLTHTGIVYTGPKRTTQLAAFKDFCKLYAKHRGLVHASEDIIKGYLGG